MGKNDKIRLTLSSEDYRLINKCSENMLPPSPERVSEDGIFMEIVCSREQLVKMAEGLRYKTLLPAEYDAEERFHIRYRIIVILYEFVRLLA